jgi:hypothetical protein
MQYIKFNKELWKKENINNPIEKICGIGTSVLALIFFGMVAIASIGFTSVIDQNSYAGEHILYEKDNVFLNILFILLFVAIAVLLYYFRDIFMKIPESKLKVGLFVYTIVVGMIWVIKVQCVPAFDSGQIYDTAAMFVKGDMTPMTISTWESLFEDMSYYQPFPHQLGLVFICEKLYQICGFETALPVEIFNVVCLALMYLGLQKIAKRLFNSKGVVLILTVILALCLQPLFMTAFPYGIIIGFSAAIWSYYFILCFMQSNHAKKALYILPATFLMVFSVLAKYNNLICVVAITIGLVVYIIREKEWISLALVAVFCIVAFNSMSIVVMHYENKSGVVLKPGVTEMMFLDMGLNESGMAPGWYNGRTIILYKKHNGDSEAATKEAKEDISKRIDKFLSDATYRRDFFGKKILSQWNEPSYESIWASQVKGHYYGKVDKESWLNKVYRQNDQDGNPVYDGSWGKKLDAYFNIYQMLMFVMFSVAMISFIRKRCNAETMILILILIGGFLYHLFFEGKSQYCVSYFVLISFFAAYGTYLIAKTVELKLPLKK